MIGKGNGMRMLDEKVCFEKWAELGSLDSVVGWMYGEGIRNKTTGRVPTRMGIQVAAMRYITKNVDMCRQVMVELGNVWAKDDDRFFTWLVRKASRSLGRAAFKIWVLSDEEKLKKYLDEYSRSILRY